MKNKKKYKLLFCDLDGTLIKTKSGLIFPKGVWDMELRLEVFEAVKRLNPQYVGIVTNQGGIRAGYVNGAYFYDKLDYVNTALEDYIDAAFDAVTSRCCEYDDPSDPDRKPNVGMLVKLYKCFSGRCGRPIAKSEMLMIGDASGKEGQYSDTDKRTAERFGIDYMDVEDFVAAYGGATDDDNLA